MKINTQLLLDVFAIQNPSRNVACNNEAMRVIQSLIPESCTVVRCAGNMIVRKGDTSKIHPFFVAHMDQVHDYVPFMRLSIDNNILSAYDGNGAQCGTGGDDKCGIYLALEMLHRLPTVSCVFVRDEEVGCLGSAIVPMEWFANAAFVLQADRNNRTFDIIRDTNGMCCASDDFMDALFDLPVASKHGEDTGSITDIGELARRKLHVSCVNISSGYHRPHQSKEIVNLIELAIACELALQAATNYGHKQWLHTATSSNNNYGYESHFKKYSRFDDFDNDYLASDDVTEDVFELTPERESLISMLEDLGYDRHFDLLEAYDTDELIKWVEGETRRGTTLV